MTKKCIACLKELPISEFYKRFPNNKLWQSRCKTCWAEYTRNHYLKNKTKIVARSHKRNARVRQEYRDFIADYLTAHPCVDCGETDLMVLQFDHVRGNKAFNVSVLVSNLMSKDKLLSEIAKCEIRCANCHVRRTCISRNQWKSRLAPVA